MYETLNDLRYDKVATLEDVEFVKDGDGTVRDGDTYIAERNTVQLLTAKHVDHENGWIVAREHAYPFDIGECVRVRLVD